MNLLKNIFYDFFSNKYYFHNRGRAYLEYICDDFSGYNGKICFFHFSLSNLKLNGYHDSEILKFIKIFYSNAYSYLLQILYYAVKNNIVVSINSLNEYEFVIKFWNENKILRNLLEYVIFKNTGKRIDFNNYKDVNFFELYIYCKENFIIKNLKIYSEKKQPSNITYINGFLDENNIFMTLNILDFDFLTGNIKEGELFKLNEPIKFSDSEYLMVHYYDKFLVNNFDKDKIYLGFVEINFEGKLIYFTDGYSIKA